MVSFSACRLYLRGSCIYYFTAAAVQPLALGSPTRPLVPPGPRALPQSLQEACSFSIHGEWPYACPLPAESSRAKPGVVASQERASISGVGHGHNKHHISSSSIIRTNLITHHLDQARSGGKSSSLVSLQSLDPRDRLYMWYL